MNLTNEQFGINLELAENRVNVLTIENPQVFSEILTDFWRQSNSEPGATILSDKDNVLNFAKDAELIINPFSVNCNDKKVITELYKELEKNIRESMFADYQMIQNTLLKMIDEAIQKEPYAISYDYELDIPGLLKLAGVKIDCNQGSILEQLIDYLRIISQIKRKKVFILVNIKHYLAAEELLQLYQMAFYEKIQIIIVEGQQGIRLENEYHQILDTDLCWVEF